LRNLQAAGGLEGSVRYQQSCCEILLMKKNPAPVDMVNIPLFIRCYTGGAGFPPPTVVDA